MASDSSSSIPLLYTWEEDRKFVLRSWCLVFVILATLLLVSMVDGRMAYMKGSYTGYLGFWTNCRQYTCADVGQVTVLIHMSMGFMLLALALCLVLLPTMALSFRSAFRRLGRVDLFFSFLSTSIGLLIIFSLMLFVANCEMLQPRPQVSYLVAFYLCLCASILMLWTGALSYQNQVRVWSSELPSVNLRRKSYRMWSLQRGGSQGSAPGPSRSATGPEPSWASSSSATLQGGPQAPLRCDPHTCQGVGEGLRGPSA